MSESKMVKNKKTTKIIIICIGVAVLIGIICIFLSKKNPEKLNVTGNTNINIANGSHVTQDEEWLYFAEKNGKEKDDYYSYGQDLVRSRFDGSDKEYLTSGNDTRIFSILEAEEEIYFIEDSSLGYIWRTDKDSSDKTLTAEGELLLSANGQRLLGVVGNKLYYLSNIPTERTIEEIKGIYSNAICYIDLHQVVKVEETLYQSDDIYIDSAVIDDGEIYFTADTYVKGKRQGVGILKTNLSDGKTEVLYKGEPDEFFNNSNASNSASLYIEQDKIYFQKYLNSDSNRYQQYVRQDVEVQEIEESTKNMEDSGAWENIICSMDKSGENMEELYYSPWISEWIIANNAIYISKNNFWEDYNLVKVSLDSETPGDVQGMIYGEYNDLQIVNNCLYYNNSDDELEQISFEDIDAQLVEAKQTPLPEEDSDIYDSDISSDISSDENYITEYDLIGSWQALDEDAEPVALEFISEDQVLIKSGVIWDEESFEEYNYSIEGGNELVFEKDGDSVRVSFEWKTNEYGPVYSEFLTIDYDEDNQVIYERMDDV